MTYKLATNFCPVCNELIDAATDPNGEKLIPEPKDVSICVYCTTYLEFDDELIARELSIESLVDLPDDTILQLHRLRKYFKSNPVKSKSK